MKPRSTIKRDLFAAESTAPKIDSLGDPLVKISRMVDFAALASVLDRVAPLVFSVRGDIPPLPTETLVRILVHERLQHLSDEQVEFPLLGKLGVVRLCSLTLALLGRKRDAAKGVLGQPPKPIRSKRSDPLSRIRAPNCLWS
jgi:hypothetical protein